MALKPDYDIKHFDISYFCNEVAQKGQFMSIRTASSGVAMDSNTQVCTASASSSGQKPAGLLMQDVASVDLTRYPINWHRIQASSGDKVALGVFGWAVTDQITGNPVAGDLAVLQINGTVSGTTLGAPWNQVAFPKVGRWVTSKDSAGYAKLFVDMN